MKIGRENQTKTSWVWSWKQNVESVKWNPGVNPYENYSTNLCVMSLRITGVMDAHSAKDKQKAVFIGELFPHDNETLVHQKVIPSSFGKFEIKTICTLSISMADTAEYDSDIHYPIRAVR